MRPASSAPMPRSRSAKTVPRAITNRMRSFASRVMMSCARPSAERRRARPAGACGRRTASPRSRRGCGSARSRRRAGAAGVGADRAEADVARSTPPRRRRAWRARASRQAVAQRRPVEAFGLERRAVAARCSSPSRTRPRRSQRVAAAARARGGRTARAAASAPDARAPRRSAGTPCTSCSSSGDVAGAKAAALRDEPAAELRAARRARGLRGSRRRSSRASAAQRARGASVPMPACMRTRDLERIDAAAAEVERDAVAGAYARRRRSGVVEHAAQLAQAPAQLAARIVRHVPQQLAQVAARDGRARRAPGRRAARAPCARAAAPAPRRRGAPSAARAGATSSRVRIVRRQRPQFAGTISTPVSTLPPTAGRPRRACVQVRSPIHPAPSGPSSGDTSTATVTAAPTNRHRGPTRGRRFRRHQGAPAGRLVLGRLCRRRHHPADRRRDALRGARPARRRSACSTSPPATATLTLAAARRWCDVTATDYVPALLERARERAAAEGLQDRVQGGRRRGAALRRRAASTSSLSTFGVMFAPDQEQCGAPSCCASAGRGGRIGLANWTPEGFIGQLFKTIGKHVPPPAGVRLAGALGHAGAPRRAVRRAGARRSTPTPRHFVFRYRSPEHWLEVFRTYYGPMLKAFAALDAGRPAGARRRPAGADRPLQPLGRCLAGRAQRVPGGAGHPSLRAAAGRRLG